MEDLLVEAAYEAFQDAGIEPKDIQAAWVGTVFSRYRNYIVPPRTPVHPYDAGGEHVRDRLRGFACRKPLVVAVGACDIALAIGVEKLKDSGQTGVKGPAIVGDNPGTEVRE